MRQRTLRTFTIAAALSGSACYTMRPVTFEQLGVARPGAVWITRSDQSEVILETPRVFGDTLVGYVNGEFQELPNTDMTGFRVRRMAGVRTAGLVGATALGVGVFVAMVTGTEKYFDPIIILDCDDNPDQVGCPNFVP